MSHYAVEIDLDNPNTSHVQVIDLVGRNKRVLDVGCWTGDVGRVLQSRGCTVSGLEIDDEAAGMAATYLDRVVIANLEQTPLTEHFERGSFDVVVFADVLEHLTDPVGALRQAQELLAEGGTIVISIPNVTHGSVRLALLQGRWNMTATGLLDRTHIKFFSRQGLFDMLAEAGLVVEVLRGTTEDPLNVEVVVDDDNLPADAVEWVRDQPDAFVYQFQARVRPGPSGTLPPDLESQGDLDVIRRQDKHHDRRIRAERDALMMKDHIIGLEVTASSARAQVEHIRGRVQRLRKTVTAKDRLIAEQETEIARLRRRGVIGLARRVKRKLQS